MSARRYVLVWLVSLCGLVGSFVFADASADAAITHQFLSQITEVPAGPGVPSSSPLQRAQAITVDAGSLYVADGSEASGRLDKLNASTGALALRFAQVPSLSYLRQGVAVAHGTGAVYVGGDEFVEGVPEGAVAVFNAAGSLQKVWKGTDTPSGGLGCFECNGPADVAVDNNTSSLTDWAAGDVYVSAPEQSVVDVFKPTAGGGEEYVTQLSEREPGVPFSEVFGVAVDPSSGDVLVIEAEGVDVLEPTVLDQYVLVRRLSETQPGRPLGHINGVTVDAGNGDVYVAEPEPRVIDQFSSAGVYLGSLRGTPAGAFGGIPDSLAVDPSSHDVYVGDTQDETQAVDIFGPTLTIPDVATAPVSGLETHSATFNGLVNPDSIQVSDCHFDYGTSAAYGQSAPCTPAAGSIPADSSEHPVSAQLAGLAPDTTYHFRLQASNANGTNTESADQEFATPGPGIHETSVLGVTSNSATLAASIDPDNTATTYYFQYGTSVAYGSEAPAAPGAAVGAGKGDVEVTQPVRLTPGTVYHYRVVVLSELGPGESFEEAGPDRTFTTQSAEAPGLLDGRAWEMVSPPDKHGASLEALSPIEGGLIQAAQDGGSITYLATGPIGGEAPGNRSLLFSQVLSTREADGWVSRDIATPSEVPAWSPTLATGEYKLFSRDLSAGLVEPSDETVLAPGSAKGAPYRREADGAFTPLVLAAGLPAGIELTAKQGVETFEGASPDLSHIVLSSHLPLLTGVPDNEKNGLYEWSGGVLRVASILPDGHQAAEENEVSALGHEGFAVRHAVSTDGSRIVWSASNGEAHLYLRDMRLGATVQLDLPEAGARGGAGAPFFQTASSDGSKVFFTDTSKLTKDATSRGGKPDLYMCEIGEAAGKPTCKLKDLSADENAREAANVAGIVVGAAEDGRYVYFAADGALAPGAAPGNCAPNGTVCNLYAYDTVTGVRRLVAALSHEDHSDWSGGNGGASVLSTVEVSPSGQYLAFMSQASLTGYDNRDANSGQPDTEVFLYDASSDRVVCASCTPSGTRPVGVSDSVPSPGLLVDGVAASEWAGHWLAGSIPGSDNESNDRRASWYQSHYLSDRGRLFFNAADALVAQDTNGLEDVYEYEPGGVGTCAGGTGCVGLISSGTSNQESALLDASESGNDVFILTAAKLSGADVDSNYDVYDAHACTAESPCSAAAGGSESAAPCLTEASCKASPTPQPAVFGPPASATFSGVGNLPSPVPAAKTTTKSKAPTRAQLLKRALRTCRGSRLRGHQKQRLACEKRARKRYGTKTKSKAKKASHGRRSK